MAKSSKKEIEKDRQNVLNELENNSNRSLNEIAVKLGFSRQKAWRIIKNLENDNVIWGYTAIVDSKKIGRKMFYILVKRKALPTPKEKIESMVNRDLRKEATKIGVRFESSYFVNGLYDALICITADDINQVKKFTDSLNNLYGENISETFILEVIFTVSRNSFDNPNIEELKEYL
jgi:DNA-binding Lrp family transcriptional regulator